MRVKNKRIAVESYVKFLSDTEILSAAFFCKKLVDREDKLSREEFSDICFFFFDGDEKATEIALGGILDMYFNEYMSRRIN